MSERRLAWLALAGVLLAALLPERMARQGPTLCPFRRATGLPCPACGLTRSWNAAARLKVRDSLRFHPLGLPALAAVLSLIARPDVAAGGRQVHPLALVVLGVSWLVVWVARLRSRAG